MPWSFVIIMLLAAVIVDSADDQPILREGNLLNLAALLNSNSSAEVSYKSLPRYLRSFPYLRYHSSNFSSCFANNTTPLLSNTQLNLQMFKRSTCNPEKMSDCSSFIGQLIGAISPWVLALPPGPDPELPSEVWYGMNAFLLWKNLNFDLSLHAYTSST